MTYTDKERNALIKMFESSGWGVFERWVKTQIDANERLPCMSGKTDEEILSSIKRARLKAEVYKGLLSNAKKEVFNG